MKNRNSETEIKGLRIKDTESMLINILTMLKVTEKIQDKKGNVNTFKKQMELK
jgi:hypothetical protein